MSFDSLLIDRCSILTKLVDTSGMYDTETFQTSYSNIPCRILRSSTTLFNPDKAQHGVMIKTKINFQGSQTIPRGGRIVHDGRAYQVVDVIDAQSTQLHHKVAICELSAGFSAVEGAGSEEGGSSSVYIREYNEIPSGNVDGSNTVFTLAFTPDPAGSLMLFQNGIYQNASGNDFSLDGATITFTEAPLSGAILLAQYLHQ